MTNETGRDIKKAVARLLFVLLKNYNFPPSSRVLFFLYKGVNGVYPKLDVPPLSLSGFSPTTQIGAILYKIIRRSRGRHERD